MAGHEIDRVGGRHLAGNDEVALILAAFVVDEDEHAAVARFVDDRLGPDEDAGRAALDQLFEPDQRIGRRIPVVRAQFAQGIGMKAGCAGEPGAADLAGGNDRLDAFDQGCAHGRRNITL